MITDLISKLINEKIVLSQALTIAKVIAYKVKNEEFKEWLNFETIGYKTDDLPSYRKIHCDLYAEIVTPYGGITTIPCDMNAVIDLSDSEYSFNEMRIVQNVATLELGMTKSNGEMHGYEYLPDSLVSQLQVINNENITKIKRRIHLSEVNYILEITKQKLLDTLLELNELFPNLENEYIMSKENEEKVKNVINNNIYGNNNSTSIGAGLNVQMNVTSNMVTKEDESYLKGLGLNDGEISELKTIIGEDDKDFNSVKSKILKWLGGVSASVAARGLYDSIPKITDYVHTFII